MSRLWDHAHDVLRQGPEQWFTDDFLASWFYLVTKNWFKSVYIMRINECVVEQQTVQRLKKLHDIIHCSFILFVLLYCALFYRSNPDCFETMDRLIWRPSWCLAFDKEHNAMRAFAQECRRRTHAVSCGRTNVHDMMRTEYDIRIQQVSTSKLLHAPCSAMRSTDDTRERCNQKTTYIVSCAWDHAHDVMHRRSEQCFTVNILFHDSTCLQTMASIHLHHVERMRSCASTNA